MASSLIALALLSGLLAVAQPSETAAPETAGPAEDDTPSADDPTPVAEARDDSVGASPPDGAALPSAAAPPGALRPPSTDEPSTSAVAPARDAVETTVAGTTASSPPVAVVKPPSHRDRLLEAVRAYQLGRLDEAQGILSGLLIDEDLDDPLLLQEVRVYMGELLQTRGQEEDARLFFEQVLREDPEYQLDAWRHPPDVVDFFNYVRAWQAALPPPPPDPVVVAPTPAPTRPEDTIAPMSVVAPLGAYHLGHGQTARGVTYLTTQAALGGLSWLLAGMLASDHYYPEGDEDKLARLNGMRYANWAVTGAAVGVWGVSVIDARNHWRRSVIARAQAPATDEAAEP